LFTVEAAVVAILSAMDTGIARVGVGVGEVKAFEAEEDCDDSTGDEGEGMGLVTFCKAGSGSKDSLLPLGVDSMYEKWEYGDDGGFGLVASGGGGGLFGFVASEGGGGLLRRRVMGGTTTATGGMTGCASSLASSSSSTSANILIGEGECTAKLAWAAESGVSRRGSGGDWIGEEEDRACTVLSGWAVESGVGGRCGGVDWIMEESNTV
jgi:hypothetical protein